MDTVNTIDTVNAANTKVSEDIKIALQDKKYKCTLNSLLSVMQILDMKSPDDILSPNPKRDLLLLTKFDEDLDAVKEFMKILYKEAPNEEKILGMTGQELLEEVYGFFLHFLEKSGRLKAIENVMQNLIQG